MKSMVFIKTTNNFKRQYLSFSKSAYYFFAIFTIFPVSASRPHMIAFAFSGSAKAVTIHRLAEYTAEHATEVGWLVGWDLMALLTQIRLKAPLNPNQQTKERTNQTTTGNNVSTVRTHTHTCG